MTYAIYFEFNDDELDQVMQFIFFPETYIAATPIRPQLLWKKLSNTAPARIWQVDVAKGGSINAPQAVPPAAAVYAGLPTLGAVGEPIISALSDPVWSLRLCFPVEVLDTEIIELRANSTGTVKVPKAPRKLIDRALAYRATQTDIPLLGDAA